MLAVQYGMRQWLRRALNTARHGGHAAKPNLFSETVAAQSPKYCERMASRDRVSTTVRQRLRRALNAARPNRSDDWRQWPRRALNAASGSKGFHVSTPETVAAQGP